MLFENLPEKKVGISSLEFRDGQQSLLGTRIKGEDMYPILEAFDKVGFHCMEMWGGATFDVAMRFLNEDPWDRLREFKKRVKNTPLRMFLRGQNLVGYKQYADDIVEKFIFAAADAGIDIFLIFDGLNDVQNCKTAIKAVKDAGKIAEANIIYAVSPVHTVEKFVQIAKDYQAMGVEAVHIEDTSGSMTPDAAFTIISELKKALNVPVHLQCHATSGLAQLCYWEALRAGVDVLDMDVSSLAMGTSHPPLESMIFAMQETPFKTDINLKDIEPINAHFKTLRAKYKEFESSFVGADIGVLQHQIPGGMLSNMELQLRQMKSLDRLDEILQEAVNVRKDFGYPPLATPFSQIVGSQATANVLTGQRYKMLSNETKDYIAGKYGKIPGEVTLELKNLVSQSREFVVGRPADLIAPEFEKYKEESKGLARTQEDILSYALFPNIAKDFLKNKYGL